MNIKKIVLGLSVLVLLLAACAPAASADPAQVVQGFWDAMKTGDVEGALAFVAEDAQCKGACYFTDKASFKFYLQGMVDGGRTTEISNVKVEGDTVTYTYKVYRNGVVIEDNAKGESMQVQDGRIIFWENLHF